MSTVRQIARKIPFVRSSYGTVVRYRLKMKKPDEVFKEIYKRNAWGGDESVSGPGSDTKQTEAVVQGLPSLLDEFDISTMLDIPCGDFQWMKRVDLSRVDYTGADIVDEIVQQNVKVFVRDRVQFRQLNLIDDDLPSVDLVLCRDCLVHFSIADISLALENLVRSGSKYLLTTTFTNTKTNTEIATGQWRPLNLQSAPFYLPAPEKILLEGCTEADGAHDDKALALWKIAEIGASLAKR